MLRGKVALGRIHIACGEPLTLDLGCDVRALANDVIAELREATVASTFHLRAFLAREPTAGVSARGLTDAIRARGGRVVESSLAGAADLPPRIEATFRAQFAHHFYPEARLAMGEHPVVGRELDRHDLRARPESRVASPEALGPGLLRAIFTPICRDYQRVARAVENGFASREALLAAEPESRLDAVEAAFEDLLRRDILVFGGDGFAPGPRADELAKVASRYAWPEDSRA